RSSQAERRWPGCRWALRLRHPVLLLPGVQRLLQAHSLRRAPPLLARSRPSVPLRLVLRPWVRALLRVPRRVPPRTAPPIALGRTIATVRVLLTRLHLRPETLLRGKSSCHHLRFARGALVLHPCQLLDDCRG